MFFLKMQLPNQTLIISNPIFLHWSGTTSGTAEQSAMLNSWYEINAQAHFYLCDLISLSGQPAKMRASLCRDVLAPLSLVGKPTAAVNQCYTAAGCTWLRWLVATKEDGIEWLTARWTITRPKWGSINIFLVNMSVGKLICIDSLCEHQH